jgi:molybdopterin-guanine dinucleotide biosynthesis protein A
MLGVILCGGQSSRMGADKGMLKAPLPQKEGYLNDANTWAQTAVDKISALAIPVVLSVNEKQLTDYSTIFSARQLVTDNAALSIKGPLSGLLSVHLQYPAEDLLLLACDMPLMETDLLKELIAQYQTLPADTFVFVNDGEPEPLCGIYTAAALSGIYHSHVLSPLPKHSMKYLLEHSNTITIPVPADKKKCFRNFNAHAELNGL